MNALGIDKVIRDKVLKNKMPRFLRDPELSEAHKTASR